MFITGNYIDIFNREIYTARLTVEGGVITKLDRIEGVYDSYIMPGLIDAHVHIESSMLVPSEFAVEAVKHGTVGVVSDPHEIANVLGLEGVEYMIESGKSVPLRFYFGAPSCVPATDFESSGARLDSSDIGNLLSRDDIYYLSEMMNYPGVINRNKEVMDKIAKARENNKPVDGHAPGISGRDLESYVSSGISTDHEAFTLEEGKEKIRLGMKILIREGSAARNLEALSSLYNYSPEMLMLCSDDIHPEMLAQRHINGLVKELVGKGYDLFDVIRSASLNPISHYKLDTGLLREGDSADFIIVRDLNSFEVLETWIEGNVVYSEGSVRFTTGDIDCPNLFNSSEIITRDIEITNALTKVKVIEVRDGELYTRSTSLKWSTDDMLCSDPDIDVLKLVVKDRYKDLPASVAFIRGLGLKEGAIASSVAHDSHNIISVGVDDKSIVQAINAVIKEKGGMAISSQGATSVLPLPVAGIMSNVPCGTIASKYLELSDKVKDMGSHLKAPFMTLSFMSLLVIPELKLGDKGLFDGLSFQFTDLFDR